MKMIQISSESIKMEPELNKFETNWILMVILVLEPKAQMNFIGNQYPAHWLKILSLTMTMTTKKEINIHLPIKQYEGIPINLQLLSKDHLIKN